MTSIETAIPLSTAEVIHSSSSSTEMKLSVASSGGTTSSNGLQLSGGQLCLDLTLILKNEEGLERRCSPSSIEDVTVRSDDEGSSSSDSMKNVSPDGRFKRNITCWDKGELLGQGSFGTVYEGLSGDGFFFAVKEVSLLHEDIRNKKSVFQLQREIDLLSELEHENIVQYYGTDKDESKLYIFLELVTKGSIRKLYQKYHLRDSQVSAYTRQILHGLKYLHNKNLVHRDIKCANILVNAHGFVKLADFGFAKEIKDINSCQGTANWMAPEVVAYSRGYGLPADIWSLGCTVLEMLTREIPYSHLHWAQAVFEIGNGKLPRIPVSLSRDARDFIMQCLQVNPADRPNVSQLLEHPFIKRPPLSSPVSPLLFRQC